MTVLNKYIKQPLASGNLANYTDAELRKIETAIFNLLTTLQGVEEMALLVETGTFVLTLTGCTTSPTVTASYYKIGKIVVLFVPAVTATSNSTSCTLTGIPAALRPTVDQGKQMLTVRDNGSPEIGSAKVLTTGIVELRDGAFSATTWTNAGTKGVDDFNLVYLTE